MKKLAIVALALLVLVGCGKKDNGGGNSSINKDSEFTVTVWYHPFVGPDAKDELMNVFNGMTKEFNEAYPKAKVEFEEIPWANRETKITTSLSGGSGPDIFYLIPDQLSQFADNELIAPIDDILPKTDLKDFSSTSLESVTYKDKLYGLPILRETQTLFYNVDILEKIGGDKENLPKTWAEFNELGKKAVDAGFYARTYDGANTLNSSLYPLIWQAGGDIVNDKDEISINNEKSVKAFELINKWYKDGFISPDSITLEDSSELFLEGKVLAAWNAGGLVPMMKENNVNYVIGSPLKEEAEVTFGVTGAFVVANTSKSKEGAAAFLETMTNPENMRAFNKVTGYIPARTSALDIYDNDADMKKLADLVQIAKPGVIHSKARIFMPDLTANMQAMLEGKVTPQEAADKSAEIIKKYIGQ